MSLAKAELGLVFQKQHKVSQAEAMLESALQIAEANLDAFTKLNEGLQGAGLIISSKSRMVIF